MIDQVILGRVSLDSQTAITPGIDWALGEFEISIDKRRSVQKGSADIRSLPGHKKVQNIDLFPVSLKKYLYNLYHSYKLTIYICMSKHLYTFN